MHEFDDKLKETIIKKIKQYLKVMALKTISFHNIYKTDSITKAAKNGRERD
jgi:hypothetical protein